MMYKLINIPSLVPLSLEPISGVLVLVSILTHDYVGLGCKPEG